MPTNILMPALSPTMTEGTLARWLKKEGEPVKSGDVLAEIETDKATMEVEAVDEGILGKILVADGTANVAVNATIAILLGEGEDASAAAAPAAPRAAVKSAEPSADAPPAAPSSGPAPASATPPAEAAPGTRIFVSPLAKRLAKEAGLDLAGIKGTGPNGRIVRADVEAAQSAPKPLAAAAPAPHAAEPSKAAAPASKPAAAITAPHKAVPNSSMRKVIARRLTEAKQSIPHFYLTADVELDALLKLRADLNARSPKDGPTAFKLSVNDLIIKASAAALRRVPGVNASFTEEAAIIYDDIDISVAVAVPDGLITPIIRKADQKGLGAISNEMKDLAARAKAGKLKLEEFQGGTFSISNLGMFGIKDFAAVINPPQGAILAVGAGEPRAVVRDGQLAVATVMSATLSVDHRVVDGALGAEWLQAFKAIVQDPLSLML